MRLTVLHEANYNSSLAGKWFGAVEQLIDTLPPELAALVRCDDLPEMQRDVYLGLSRLLRATTDSRIVEAAKKLIAQADSINNSDINPFTDDTYQYN